MDEEFPRRTIGFFLAPSVAQEMQISVRLSVCPMKSVLEITIFIFLSQVSLRLVSGRYLVLFRLGFH